MGLKDYEILYNFNFQFRNPSHGTEIELRDNYKEVKLTKCHDNIISTCMEMNQLLCLSLVLWCVWLPSQHFDIRHTPHCTVLWRYSVNVVPTLSIVLNKDHFHSYPIHNKLPHIWVGIICPVISIMMFTGIVAEDDNKHE